MYALWKHLNIQTQLCFHTFSLGGSTSSKPNADQQQVMIRVPDTGTSKGVKSLNAPIMPRLLELRYLVLAGVRKKSRCIECRQPMTSQDHYK